MKKWQEERNYRRIYNEAGEVIANIITVFRETTLTGRDGGG